MSRPRSDATIIKSLEARVRYLERELAESRSTAFAYSRSNTAAKAAASEWKARFDALLRVMPEKK